MLENKNIKTTLDELIEKNDTIYIVPHIRADYDALGASMGLSLICKKYKKRCSIVIDDDISKIDSEIRKMINDIKAFCDVINSDDIILDNKSALITVDVNKNYLISSKVNDLLPKFGETMIIDHHKADVNTIKVDNSFINDKLSSTCEEVSRLVFSYGVRLLPKQANYLLAGILLDTYRLSKNANSETLKVVSKLCDRGANISEVNNMFLEDFDSDKRMLGIISNTNFTSFIYAVACANDDIYQIEDIAKAADYLLKYKIDASFALGYIDNEIISISARSKGRVDVSSIMKLFGGGGNEFSAATKIKGYKLEEINSRLNEILNIPIACEEKESLQLKLLK